MILDFTNTIVAILGLVFLYGVTAIIKIRRDIRQGRREDLDLFAEIKKAAADQMSSMSADVHSAHEQLGFLRTEINEVRDDNKRLNLELADLRRRLTAAEARASQAEERANQTETRANQAEERANKAEAKANAAAKTVELALRHIGLIEDALRKSGVEIPPRPPELVRPPS